MEQCPCGSLRPLEACCGPFLDGRSRPETAEKLMRSRYTAYATGAVDYVLATQLDDDRPRVEGWAKKSRFTELRLLATRDGGPDDASGQVEFEAVYESEGHTHVHREISHFERGQDGAWVFAKGHPPIQTRTFPKVGRNDPCPCSSGKKFKKCCGS